MQEKAEAERVKATMKLEQGRQELQRRVEEFKKMNAEELKTAMGRESVTDEEKCSVM
jgi:hypothetical protein